MRRTGTNETTDDSTMSANSTVSTTNTTTTGTTVTTTTTTTSSTYDPNGNMTIILEISPPGTKEVTTDFNATVKESTNEADQMAWVAAYEGKLSILVDDGTLEDYFENTTGYSVLALGVQIDQAEDFTTTTTTVTTTTVKTTTGDVNTINNSTNGNNSTTASTISTNNTDDVDDVDDVDDSESSSTPTGAVVGGAIAAVAVIAIIVGVVIHRRREQLKSQSRKSIDVENQSPNAGTLSFIRGSVHGNGAGLAPGASAYDEQPSYFGSKNRAELQKDSLVVRKKKAVPDTTHNAAFDPNDDSYLDCEAKDIRPSAIQQTTPSRFSGVSTNNIDTLKPDENGFRPRVDTQWEL